MTPEELGQLRQVYETAITITGRARETYLDRECQGQAEFRAQVERLIEAHNRVPAWLDEPAVGPAPPVAEAVVPMQGRRLGCYTLIREIGRGGMGSVYLAERSDGAFRKQVAIKLVVPSGNTAKIISTFQQEREILATLDHPNIARLIDGGSTDEGWPYFVMEYVDGQPIHRWCNENRLSISQRIRLFRSVLSPVQYAHQRLIVHRDLKPSNILVTSDGTVKLLDFGIAALLSAKDHRRGPCAATLARMMTTQYASPEQRNGGAITTLTDIYSLGVVLYELVTGQRPPRTQNATASDVVEEAGIPPPSEVVAAAEGSVVREGDPKRLRKRLAGDLDSILLRALQVNLELRYSSVESFGDDLQRHLEHRPVKAREATLWYRFRSFCRRNPSGVASTVLLVISVLSGLGAVVWQARRDLEAAQINPSGGVFLGPVWVIFYGAAIVVLGVAIYFARPNRSRLVGAFAGGSVWAMGVFAKYRIGDSLGWWRSRVAGTPDPLSLFSPYLWLGYSLAGMALLLIVFLIGRRFGWKIQVAFIGALGFFVELRERFWFSVILPALTYQAGPGPVAGSAALIIAGGVLGLLVMRLIAGPETRRR